MDQQAYSAQNHDRSVVISALTYRYGVGGRDLDACMLTYSALPAWRKFSLNILLCWPNEAHEAEAREWIASARRGAR